MVLDKKKKRITNTDLNALIEGLAEYKDHGVIDPWILSDGTTIEPLDILVELKELRGEHGS